MSSGRPELLTVCPNTATAANLDLGMGVDAMIYLTMFPKRENADLSSWEPWSKACSHLWRPIGTSLLVICCGSVSSCSRISRPQSALEFLSCSAPQLRPRQPYLCSHGSQVFPGEAGRPRSLRITREPPRLAPHFRGRVRALRSRCAGSPSAQLVSEIFGVQDTGCPSQLSAKACAAEH